MPDSSPPSGYSPGTSITVRFTDMAYGGEAVGRAAEAGVAVFGWPGITGETARVEITEERKNLVRGAVSEVLVPSPLRVEPPCPYFGPCGGCQWQHIDYAGQVEFKHRILRSQLERMGGLKDAEAVMKLPIQSPLPYGYRNTSHFAIAAASRSLGYFKHDSHSIVAVERCPISNDGINAVMPLVNTLLAAAPGEDVERQPKGIMRLWQVTVRSSPITRQTLVILHTRAGGAARPRSRHGGRGREPQRPERGPSLEPSEVAAPDIPLVRREVRRAVGAQARRAGEDLGGLTVLEVMEDGTINMLGGTRAASSLAADLAADALSGASLDSGLERMSAGQGGPPPGAWAESLGGRTYWVAPEAFFQANTAAAELLLDEVEAHVPRRFDFLVDAHAGVGTFALALAGRAKRVLAFEVGNSAVASGRWTAASLDARNVEFRQGRAEQLLPRLAPSERPDLILLDPPRAGCRPELLAEIARRGIPHVVYVSCDPSTLARDVKLLAAGYSVESVRMVDMFPQTFHLESVTVLQKK